MKREQILAILYEMAIVIGGEIRLDQLLTRTLQRLLFHTAFPCGMVFLDAEQILSPGYCQEFSDVRLETSIGDFELGRLNKKTIHIPTALLRGGFELVENPDLLGFLPCRKDYYTVFLRLPIDVSGVILLLASRMPETDLPLTGIFQPVLSNFAKAILLCRSNDAYTQELERKNAELERMNKLFVGRELRMIELKEKIKELEKQTGGTHSRLFTEATERKKDEE